MHTARNGRVFDESGTEVAVYETVKRYGVNDYEPPKPRMAGDEVHEMVCDLRRQHPGRLTYSQALHQILDDPKNFQLKCAFAAETGR
jgi:hypothetical protein